MEKNQNAGNTKEKLYLCGDYCRTEFPVNRAKNYGHSTPVYSYDIVVGVREGILVNDYYWSNTLSPTNAHIIAAVKGLNLGDTLRLVKDSAGIITETTLKTPTFRHIGSNVLVPY